MKNTVRRIFVEKKKAYNTEAGALLRDLRDNLGISGLKDLRIINRYDVEGLSEEEFATARNTVFSEPPVDISYLEEFKAAAGQRILAIEYLPGQYDQRADSASQCIQLLTCKERPQCRAAKLIVLEGEVSDEQFEKVRSYCINPVESQEASMDKPDTLDLIVDTPSNVEILKGFINMGRDELEKLMKELALAMSAEDLEFCRDYFRDEERRDPTITEIRLLDTYWSDHCRHTTFLTKIEDVEIENGPYSGLIREAYKGYLDSREFVYPGGNRDINLMDIATLAMKDLRKKGRLPDLDASEEINACSIVVNAVVDGKNEEWLVMFKNETHNHPTEIEPFGGAATCLGGAIRDPLSGRSYVYQAMRVTGSGDPGKSMEETLPGKLPQRKITTGAAAGFSSYGNQIGLATGQVAEIYDEGYVAKRMEIGAVIGAAPRANVIREVPSAGDAVVLLGGRTGRDGCGGATGSSKEHDEESLMKCGAEVQKGNPPTERKIQRLFRKPEVSVMIKRCNDFGAGGVSVAIGELADGLDIDLDKVPKKYEGLDGTELAISESQERMAVVVSRENTRAFIEAAAVENLEATQVAVVTDTNRLKMTWRGNIVVDVNRDFLNSNGAKQKASVKIKSPMKEDSYFSQDRSAGQLRKRWLKNLGNLNICSQKGLVERFDSTIGAGTILMPFGGKYQLSPAEGMAAKLPVLGGNTVTGTLMAYGYNPSIARWSPFHGAVFAVVEAVAKIAAMGGDYSKARLTLQEYFEKLGNDPYKWGKPFSALLGAFYAQMKLGIPAIGGKDSMSGTFRDLNVPPTLVAFAVEAADISKTVSTDFKQAGSDVVLIRLKRDANDMPDFDMLHGNLELIARLAHSQGVLSAMTIKSGGIAEAVSKMCFGGKIGFAVSEELTEQELFSPDYGSVILELDASKDLSGLFGSAPYTLAGHTIEEAQIKVGNTAIELDEALEAWERPLERVFQTKTAQLAEKPEKFKYTKGAGISSSRRESGTKPFPTIARPKVFIPVFPGTNCEYDTAAAFEKAGGEADVFVVRNLASADIEESIEIMVRKINNSQIVMLPGGFSGGDEPDGSGKFIATAFRNPYMKEAVHKLLKQRDGLMLGICNGFQALIKLGLVPYGEIRDMEEGSPTLTFNTIGRHVSCMVRTRVCSNLSPWLSKVNTGDIHTIAVSHGEGRFVCSMADLESMKVKGQIATQYVDLDGNPSNDIRFNPNGSVQAIEGITSPDGRVFGKMAHSERIGKYIAGNIPGEKDQKLFEAGVGYFG